MTKPNLVFAESCGLLLVGVRLAPKNCSRTLDRNNLWPLTLSRAGLSGNSLSYSYKYKITIYVKAYKCAEYKNDDAFMVN